MYEVPIIRSAILGRILAHRGDDDAIHQTHFAKMKGSKHGRRNRINLFTTVAICKPAIHALDVSGIAFGKITVGNPLAATKQLDGKLLGGKILPALDVLK